MISGTKDITRGVVIGGNFGTYTLHNADGEQQGRRVHAKSDASALREFKDRHPRLFTSQFRERYGPYEVRCQKEPFAHDE